MQFDRREASDASVMKYASQVGRRRVGDERSSVPRKAWYAEGVPCVLRIER
jgi:hypothetical protein